MSTPVAVSALQKLVDAGQITPEDIAAKVKSGEIELHDDRADTPAAAAPSEGKSVEGFAHNLVSSAADLGGSLVTAAAHPFETAKGLASVVMGGAQEAGRALGDKPVGVDYAPAFDAFVDRMKRRYGGVQNVIDTAYKDPIGTALDASAVISGVGGGLRMAGMEGAANAMKTAAEVIDPIRLGSRVVGAVAKPVVKAAESVLGGTTGVGSDVIKTASEGSDAFKAGLRGETTSNDVLEQTQGALKDLADQRNAAYQKRLGELPSDVTLPIDQVQSTANRLLKRMGVDVLKTADGKIELNFDRADIPRGPQRDAIANMVDDLSSWGSKAGDNTPLGIDLLKRRLGDVAGAGGKADKIISGTQDAVRTLLEDNVPGYKSLTKDYAQATEFLDTVTKELSSKNPGAAIRKLTTALNQNNGYRRALVDALDQATGGDIRGAIAGTAMHDLAPRGGLARLVASGEAFAAVAHPAFAVKLAGALATASPRIVGELLLGLSKARKAAQAIPVSQQGVTAAAAAARSVQQ